MASNLAVIPWNGESNNAVAKIDENSRPEGGRWALLLKAIRSPTSGRTMDQVYTTLGKVVETQANRAAYAFGLGPQVVAQKIKVYFGNADETVQRLELLATSVPPKLEKRCSKLMKYALPTESANVQCQAFKNIVHLVTSFPGLRVVLLRTKFLDAAPSLDILSELWGCSSGGSDDNWEFWKILAATCLTESTISTMVEGSRVSDLSNCQQEGLSAVEQLMVQHDCLDSQYSSVLCLRYLGGILGFPAFWQDMAETRCYVVNKLCSKLVKVLKDIGVDILALGPIQESELPFDYEGVDLLATNLLTGVLGWFNKLNQNDWAKQLWYESFKEVLQLLRRPRASELLPNAFAYATNSFNEQLPTAFEDAELELVVDGDNETTCPPKNRDDSLEELEHKCGSTTSLHSAISDQEDGQLSDSAQEDENDPQYPNSDQNSLGSSPSIVSLSDEDSDNSDMEMDHIHMVDSGQDFGHSSNSTGDTDMPHSGAVMFPGTNTSSSTSYLKALQQEEKDCKIVLFDKQRDLGDDHLETLTAMEDLAWTYFELGKYRLAKDLGVVVLEKRRVLLGDNDPLTVHSMRNMVPTLERLGQFQEAKSLGLEAVERQRQVLGESHSDTLQTCRNLVYTYGDLGQFEEAENLAVHVLNTQKETLGEHHPDTLHTMSALANIYKQLGQLKEAESLAVQVFNKQCETLGEHHQDTLHTMQTLATIYRDLGQLEDSEHFLIQVQKNRQEISGENHPSILITMSQLGLTYLQSGKLNAAEELFATVLPKQQNILGKDHPNTLVTLDNLAWVYYNQGKFDHAQELYIEVLEKRRKINGTGHPDTRQTMSNLAITYRTLQKEQEAEELEALLGAPRM